MMCLAEGIKLIGLKSDSFNNVLIIISKNILFGNYFI